MEDFLQSLVDFSMLHFLQPWTGLLLVPLAFVLWRLWQPMQQKKRWQQLCDERLLVHFLRDKAGAQVKTVVFMVAAAGVVLIFALARPVWQKLPQPNYQAPSALVIALDLSASMLATDLKPTRLKQAQFKIRDLLAQRGDGQTAMVVYAGDAYVVTPLTQDIDTITSQLDALSPAIMPVQGSHPERAVKLARQLLAQAGHAKGDILLISDELDPVLMKDELGVMAESNIRLSILASAVETSVPVPGLKYRNGEPVLALYNPDDMKQVVNDGKGLFFQLSHQNSDVVSLSQFFAKNQQQLKTLTEAKTDQWVAGGPWFVLLVLPLVLMMFRRGFLTAASVIFTLTLTMPEPALALEWDDMWRTADQQGVIAFKNKDYEKAAQLFEDVEWKQAALYRQGKFDQAVAAQPAPETASQWYNQANALAQLKQYERAIKAYEQAIALKPEHADAKHNLEAVKKALAQQAPNKEQEQQNNSSQQQNSADSDREKKGETASESENDQPKGSDQSSPPPNGDAEPAGNSGKPKPDAQAEQAQQDMKEALDNRIDTLDEKPQKSQQSYESSSTSEINQAKEQLLNKVIDDPAGLWRRKFYYQYQQGGARAIPGEKQW